MRSPIAAVMSSNPAEPASIHMAADEQTAEDTEKTNSIHYTHCYHIVSAHKPCAEVVSVNFNATVCDTSLHVGTTEFEANTITASSIDTAGWVSITPNALSSVEVSW